MDSLGDRMKGLYENRSRIYLPRKTYSVIRIDGKAFHTYTKGMTRPFDIGFMEDMNETARYLCENIQGAKVAYVQSDEISIVLTDFDKINTDMWFNGNIQKIVSVSASLATARFNQLRFDRCFSMNNEYPELQESLIQYKHLPQLAMFDSRVFSISTFTEVINYLIWRQQDTVRNSIQSVAQSLYSHKELNGKNQSDLQEMIFQKGINWNDYPISQKRGRLTYKSGNGWDIDGAPTFEVISSFWDDKIPRRSE